MNKYNFKIIHDQLLNTLLEFDRICRNNKIIYSLEGGTLLGAVKYNSFVPWDDDIDVVMLRDDYTKFLNACKKDLDTENFVICNYFINKRFPLNYSKLCFKNSKLDNADRTITNESGYAIFVDIFPIDNVCEKNFKHQKHIVGFLTASKRRKLKIKTKNKNVFKTFGHFVFSLLPLGILNRLILRACTKNNKKKTKLAYEICNQNRTFEPMPISTYTDVEPILFCGHYFLATKNRDHFLRSRFGNNYLVDLPPEEIRKPSHFSTLDFE